MQIAAILTVPAEDPARKALAWISRNKHEEPRSFAKTDILGASLLERTIANLKEVGAHQPKVLSDRSISSQVLPSRSARSSVFIDAWEKAVSDYINNGAETLVLVRVGAYADVDYSELLRFHASSGSPLTQAYSGDGSLEIAVVDAKLLRNADDLIRRVLSHLIPQQRRFHYSGYVNRLRRTQDLHRLMQDGLSARCALRPLGREIRPGVWCKGEAGVDPTATINGNAFIGEGARIGPGCMITGPSSIEAGCRIDCATRIDNSLVLQGTYVGMALDVRRAVVGDEKIFSLDRNVEVSVSDERLIGRSVRPPMFFAGVRSRISSGALSRDSEVQSA